MVFHTVIIEQRDNSFKWVNKEFCVNQFSNQVQFSFEFGVYNLNTNKKWLITYTISFCIQSYSRGGFFRPTISGPNALWSENNMTLWLQKL